MRCERQFLRFLAAWSGVSLLNAVLNACTGDLPSLPHRGFALGVLLLVAAATHSLDRAAVGACDSQTAGLGIERQIYAALLVAVAVPSVAWRCLSPLDVSGLASLTHGASITFIFGIVTLVAVRVTTHRVDATGRQAA